MSDKDSKGELKPEERPLIKSLRKGEKVMRENGFNLIADDLTLAILELSHPITPKEGWNRFWPVVPKLKKLHKEFKDKKRYGAMDIIGGAISAIEGKTSESTAPKEEWISVKERLPKGTETNPIQVQVANYAKGFYVVMCSAYDGNGFWSLEHWAMGKHCPGITHVTHWMPLPSPPKKEGKNEEN